MRQTLLGIVLAASGCSDEAIVEPPLDDDGMLEPLPPDARCESESMVVMGHYAKPVTPALAEQLAQCARAELLCADLCVPFLPAPTPPYDYTYGPYGTLVEDAEGYDLTCHFYMYRSASGCPIPGRRPRGLRRSRIARAGVTATQLGRDAWMEAASVHAFVRLAHELRRHGAPTRLVTAASRAAADEVVHAEIMAALARSRGVEPPAPQLAAHAPRSLAALARENAVEGEVHETWAALVATWQARHAPTPLLRAAYARIAADETRHAALARAVATWLDPQLSRAARTRVAAARTRAVTALSRATRRGPHAALVRDLGLPAAPAMQRLFAGAHAALWAPA